MSKLFIRCIANNNKVNNNEMAKLVIKFLETLYFTVEVNAN